MIPRVRQTLVACLSIVAITLGLAGFSAVSVAVDAVPAAAKTTKAPMSQSKWVCDKKRTQSCVSRFGYKGKSAWKYPVDKYGNNCTNYVAFRLSKDKKKAQTYMGNAISWAAAAKKRKLTVNKTPTVGSVAQWATPKYGHVAYVDWVSADKKTIYISSTSFDDSGTFSRSSRSVLKKEKRSLGVEAYNGWPKNFIKFTAAPKTTSPKKITGAVMVKTQRMSKATLKSTQRGWYAKKSKLSLKCYVRGQKVKGYYSASFKNGWDDLWYKVSDGHYVADVDLRTGSNKPITKKC